MRLYTATGTVNNRIFKVRFFSEHSAFKWNQNSLPLKQRPVMTATSEQKKLSRKAAEQKRRQGKLERHERVRKLIYEAMVHTSSRKEFIEKLSAKHCQFYTRGKHYGVEVQHPDGRQEKYRFATLGVHEEFENYLSVLEAMREAQAFEEPSSKPKTEQAKSEERARPSEKAQAEEKAQPSDKSNADKVEATSRQRDARKQKDTANEKAPRTSAENSEKHHTDGATEKSTPSSTDQPSAKSESANATDSDDRISKVEREFRSHGQKLSEGQARNQSQKGASSAKSSSRNSSKKSPKNSH